MLQALQASACVYVAASEELEAALLLPAARQGVEEAPFAVVFDPLDGSRNIDAGIPTGKEGRTLRCRVLHCGPRSVCCTVLHCAALCCTVLGYAAPQHAASWTCSSPSCTAEVVAARA